MFRQFFLFLSPIYKYHIAGLSMSPTFSSGDVVLVNRLAFLFKKPQKGHLIALHDPRDRKVLIKRIIKVAGKRYFVQGDNKKLSTDSRVFGMIKRSDIIGKVITT